MEYNVERAGLPALMHEGEAWDARRREIMEILMTNEYGRMPEAPNCVRAEVRASARDFAGKALHETVLLTFDTPCGACSFPVEVILPVRVVRAPVFLNISFHPGAQDAYCPTEEIIDSGYGLARMYYKDVVNDNCHGDFSDGLGQRYVRGARKGDEWGKIGMWAFGAMRVMDYLITRADVDSARVAVIGHSRLGKTSLWAGAMDTRFAAVIANDSGAGGGALYRGKTGEHIKDFVKSGLWDWFAENVKAHAQNERDMPFDQHYLLSLIAPRLLAIGTAREDVWADPESERDACLEASPAYRAHGLRGLDAPRGALTPGDEYLSGEIGFHMRAGTHFLSREDWQAYIRFLNAHGWA